MLVTRPHLTIGELCEEFGVTARALRFYEDEALISPERRGTQRLYSERDRARLAWILRGKRVGLSLSDIKELLDLYDVGDGRRTQRLATIAHGDVVCTTHVPSAHQAGGAPDQAPIATSGRATA